MTFSVYYIVAKSTLIKHTKLVPYEGDTVKTGDSSSWLAVVIGEASKIDKTTIIVNHWGIDYIRAFERIRTYFFGKYSLLKT